MVKKILVITVSLLALVALGYMVTMAIVKPIGTDFSVVGKGKPALVLAYENFSPSGESLSLVSKVRDDYNARVEFVVADLGTPQGKKFASRYQLKNGQAVFLKKDGQLLEITYLPEDEQSFRTFLEIKLKKVE